MTSLEQERGLRVRNELECGLGWVDTVISSASRGAYPREAPEESSLALLGCNGAVD